MSRETPFGSLLNSLVIEATPPAAVALPVADDSAVVALESAINRAVAAPRPTSPVPPPGYRYMKPRARTIRVNPDFVRGVREAKPLVLHCANGYIMHCEDIRILEGATFATGVKQAGCVSIRTVRLETGSGLFVKT